MTVLIDDYVTDDLAVPLVAEQRYQSAIKTSFNTTMVINTRGGFRARVSLNQRIHKLLREISLLRQNWDDDGSDAPNADCVLKAKFITNVLERHGQKIYHVAPGPYGEIMLDIRSNDFSKSLELIFYPKRSVAVRFSDGGGSQEEFLPENIPALLQWLNSDAYDRTRS